jgi:hypothetical protein
MRAHLGTHREPDFHLVKCPLEIRRRNGANDGTAFVALDTRVLSTDDGHQAAATVRCSEICVSQDWAVFRLLLVAVHDSRISRRPPRVLIESVSVMVGVSCPYCLALLAEMRSAIMEVNAILENARARTRLGDVPAPVDEWNLSARHRWLDASTDLANHLATHPANPTCFGQERLPAWGLLKPAPV